MNLYKELFCCVLAQIYTLLSYSLVKLFYIVFFVKCWPDGTVYYPDFSKEECQDWWQNEYTIFHDTIEFDGVWVVRYKECEGVSVSG